jgi:chemotaxis protein MotB
MRQALTASEQSGVLVSPPSPRARTSGRWKKTIRRAIPWTIGVLLLSGSAFAATHVVFRDEEPLRDPLPSAQAEASEARKEAIDAEGRARAAENELASVKARLAELDAKAAEDAKAAAATAAEQRKKLSGIAGKDGSVTQDGDAIRLELVDKVLFRVGDAELTDRGQKVLARVGKALNELPDRQIWVHGHTDDSPITPAEGIIPKYESNWELSAARALTVVHYLQDDAGVDPKRLAAVAFGQHRPASKAKAKNRRIEIVLYPKHQVAK